ncbi:J domain-containing protein [Riemerella anatipestifer]|nr:J domain-containing protein [Riemerella anatipestifer]
MNNYYKILNISESATPDEIKRSYRRLALIYHPDRESGDVRMFLKIKNAYDVLIDEKEREKYDLELKINRIFEKGQNSETKQYRNFYREPTQVNKYHKLTDTQKTILFIIVTLIVSVIIYLMIEESKLEQQQNYNTDIQLFQEDNSKEYKTGELEF